jgi:hypothetical protein
LLRDPRLAPFRAPVLAFSALALVQAISGAVLFGRKLGFSAEDVRAFYLGSEAAFTRPRSLAGLLEVAVPHLVAIPVVLFTTVHLVGFLGLVRRRPHAVLTAVAFGSALAGIGAGFAIRFLWPGLAPLKIAAFVAFELVLLGWLVLVAFVYWPPRAARQARSAGPGSRAVTTLPSSAGRRAATEVAP